MCEQTLGGGNTGEENTCGKRCDKHVRIRAWEETLGRHMMEETRVNKHWRRNMKEDTHVDKHGGRNTCEET